MVDRRLRVVVADDDEAILELVSIRLDLAGYQTIPRRDGYLALDAIYNSDPHAVVLDIGMPKMDGFGVLRTLRAHKKYHALPVMILSARNNSQDVLSAMSLGANDYLAKPFRDGQLLARVARLTSARPDRRTAIHFD